MQGFTITGSRGSTPPNIDDDISPWGNMLSPKLHLSSTRPATSKKQEPPKPVDLPMQSPKRNFIARPQTQEKKAKPFLRVLNPQATAPKKDDKPPEFVNELIKTRVEDHITPRDKRTIPLFPFSPFSPTAETKTEEKHRGGNKREKRILTISYYGLPEYEANLIAMNTSDM